LDKELNVTHEPVLIFRRFENGPKIE